MFKECSTEIYVNHRALNTLLSLLPPQNWNKMRVKRIKLHKPHKGKENNRRDNSPQTMSGNEGRDSDWKGMRINNSELFSINQLRT